MAQGSRNQIADAVLSTLISPSEPDRNFEAANVVDGLFAIARAIHRLAEVIEETKCSPRAVPSSPASEP